jgi:hypothetical protein
MPVTIGGAPTHVLIVHVIVVLLPVSVLASLLLVAVPATRKAFSLLTLLVGLVACVAIPLAFLSGSRLEARVPPSPLITRHVHLAHELLPIAAVFGVVLAAFVAVDVAARRRAGQLNQLEHRLIPAGPAAPAGRATLGWAGRVVAAVLVVMAVATGIQVYRVGEAGAKAAWSGRLAQHSAPAPGRFTNNPGGTA